MSKSTRQSTETAGVVAVAYMLALIVTPYLEIPAGISETVMIGALTAGIAAIGRFIIHRTTTRNGRNLDI